ncbi:MAG: sensor domain-containing diguanylate cyclase [Phascolarctobacterium sp.]|nr:sensor domain-containing diguanylate cyclase [Phascolarctobacterium sp.]
MLDYKRSYNRFIIAGLCVFLLFGYVFFQIQKTVARLDTDNEVRIEQNVQTATQTIEAKLGFAESRIRVISHNIGMALTTSELKNHKFILAPYMENSPFTFIEYVRADGVNELSDGTALNASDRVYYIEGMKGKSGIWVNFYPALSKEVLVNYYTPLRYQNNIIGVLTGVIGGDSGLKNVLQQDFFGEVCYNVLCDAQGRIVTTNGENSFGTSLEQYLAAKGIVKEHYAKIMQQLQQCSSQTFKIERNGGYMLVSFANVSDLNCFVLQIVPETTISTLKNRAMFSYYGILTSLVLLLIFIGISYKYDEKMYKAIKNAQKELEISTAISKMYYSVHIIDLLKDEAEEYLSNDSVRQLISQKKKASEKIFLAMETLSKPEWQEQVLSFVDLKTLPERLQEQDFAMFDFEGIHFWMRSFFAVMERDEQHRVTKVIFVTRIIDKYMKEMEKLHRKSNVDQLTGLSNRRAYEDNIKEHINDALPQNFVLASIDINGLKDVNDKLGHAAGDEMLKGAAACLERCLGSYGSVYRMGGDEFTAMLFVDDAKLEEIKKDLEATVRAWHGNLVKELHFACGYASKGKYPNANLQQLTKLADGFMYDDKEHYYNQDGLDRRRKQYVYDAICSSYTKILRVNLTKDSYTIIRLDEDERKSSRPNTISGWLKSFGNSESIHADDRQKFLEATKLEDLRTFFKNNQNHYSLYYRRDIHGEYKYVSMEIFAANDYTNDQQIVYLLVKDVGNSNF